MDARDPFNLERFVEAQDGGVYDQALAELRDGAKRSHWMWFIFPQHQDLGRSQAANHYGLTGVEEATAYLAHPLLGPRLLECCEAILPQLRAGVSVQAILGDVDAMKLNSSMEIFSAADPGDHRFAEIIRLCGRR